MAVDLAGFSDAMDRCWLEHRFDGLADYLAPDIVVVAPGGAARLEGRDRAIASYRDFMQRSRVRSFRSSDHQVTQRGDAAILEYRWQMKWEADGDTHDDEGREILVLSRSAGDWRVIWRTQVPVAREG